MLEENVRDYETLKEAVISISRVPITEEKLDDVNGYFSPNEQRIVINEGMSESQTINTLLHEIAHSRRHDPKNKDTEKKDRNTKEVEAESVAFTVSNYFGINTDSYSFGYILGWSKSLELKEFKESLETIRKTSSEMIDDLSKALITQKDKTKTSIHKRLIDAKKTVKEIPETHTKKKEALLA